jgi:hypothetical protein
MPKKYQIKSSKKVSSGNQIGNSEETRQKVSRKLKWKMEETLKSNLLKLLTPDGNFIGNSQECFRKFPHPPLGGGKLETPAF